MTNSRAGWIPHRCWTSTKIVIPISSIYPYLSISIHIYPYLSISIHIYPYLSISIYIYLYLSISIYIYLYLSISIYIYLYLSISIYIYPSIYPSIYIYIDRLELGLRNTSEYTQNSLVDTRNASDFLQFGGLCRWLFARTNTRLDAQAVHPQPSFPKLVFKQRSKDSSRDSGRIICEDNFWNLTGGISSLWVKPTLIGI